MTGDIGADIAHYFTQSEQIPSAVAVSTIPNSDNSGVEISGGYLIQHIPQDGGYIAERTVELEKIIATINSGMSLNTMLLQKVTPEKVIETIFAGVEYEILDRINLSFECTCNRGMLMAALNMLADENKKEFINNEENIEIVCEFCKKIYYI